MKRIFVLLPVWAAVLVLAHSEPMYSPTWGFFLDLPEGYEFIEGDGRDRFSFAGPAGLMFDLVVYNGRYESIQDLVININKNISNRGDAAFFSYYDKNAAIMDLFFDNYKGYALCVELSGDGVMMAALAYAPADIDNVELFHFSALDSIAPSINEKLRPGPVTHFGYPRGELKNITIAGGIPAKIYENDAEAAQDFIEREFAVFRAYSETDYGLAAATRYYRFIFRDSFDRVVNPAFALAGALGGLDAETPEAKFVFAQRALHFVQGFEYERDFAGSDFLNLVSAVAENRGDCDSRAMLWAIILTCADIRAAMGVSFYYGHALGLADLEGPGTRFEAYGVNWLVAETTSNLDLGLIYEEVSDGRFWTGIIFE